MYFTSVLILSAISSVLAKPANNNARHVTAIESTFAGPAATPIGTSSGVVNITSSFAFPTSINATVTATPVPITITPFPPVSTVTITSQIFKTKTVTVTETPAYSCVLVPIGATSIPKPTVKANSSVPAYSTSFPSSSAASPTNSSFIPITSTLPAAGTVITSVILTPTFYGSSSAFPTKGVPITPSSLPPAGTPAFPSSFYGSSSVFPSEGVPITPTSLPPAGTPAFPSSYFDSSSAIPTTIYDSSSAIPTTFVELSSTVPASVPTSSI